MPSTGDGRCMEGWIRKLAAGEAIRREWEREGLQGAESCKAW